jgi:hypothetical protein
VAALTSQNVAVVYESGQADLVKLFSLRNVTTGDTIDLATISNMQVVKAGVVLGVSDFVEIAATFTGTVVTMPSGLSKSSAWLLVLGC